MALQKIVKFSSLSVSLRPFHESFEISNKPFSSLILYMLLLVVDSACLHFSLSLTLVGSGSRFEDCARRINQERTMSLFEHKCNITKHRTEERDGEREKKLSIKTPILSQDIYVERCRSAQKQFFFPLFIARLFCCGRNFFQLSSVPQHVEIVSSGLLFFKVKNKIHLV